MSLSQLVRGDDWKFTATILDPQGTPVDITGGSVWITFKSDDNMGQADSNADFQLSDLDIQDVDDPDNDVVNGVVVLRANHASAGTPPDNTLIAAGKYNYDLQYKATSGEIVTVEDGSVTVKRHVTWSS